ncbi:hypothetical protein EV426DRAFT_722035 [Tirmania nivea]|nr:hypothetical protein EV426DRAFT_722035 [Tirmania nivea]
MSHTGQRRGRPGGNLRVTCRPYRREPAGSYRGGYQARGQSKTEGHTHALTAYTWLCTTRAGQNYWLDLIRKCPYYHHQCQVFIGVARTWEDLDTVFRKKDEGVEEEWDTVEAYFAYLYRPLAGG